MFLGKLFGLAISGLIFAAFPSSTNYKLQSWGVNSGGTNSASGSTYKLRGTAGEITGQATTSTTYSTKSGAIQAAQASVPPAPTVDNGSGTYYNKLHFVVNNSANPSDATFAIQISTVSNFSSFSYIQADGSSGAGIVWQTYTSWGGASGTYAIGLTPNTTYYFRVSAQQGKFTASAWGPSANVATANPSLTFSVSPNTLNMGNLTAGSIITSSTITFSYTTNAVNGGFIYMSGSSTGLVSASNSNYNIQISPPSGNLSSLAEGSGLQATGTASLVVQSPYTATGTSVGAFYTSFQPLFVATGPVTTGSPTASVLAKSKISTPAGTDYTNTLTFVAAASY